MTFCQARRGFGGTPRILRYFASLMLGIRRALCVRKKEGFRMEMLLMVGCLSLFGLAVTCLAFGAATHSEADLDGGAARAQTR